MMKQLQNTKNIKLINMELIKALINSEQAENVSEALEIINEMKNRVIEGEDPEEILFEFGLEPDYVFDILY